MAKKWMDCPDCDGYGYVRQAGVHEGYWPACERCEGKSEVPADPAEEKAWRASPAGLAAGQDL